MWLQRLRHTFRQLPPRLVFLSAIAMGGLFAPATAAPAVQLGPAPQAMPHATELLAAAPATTGIDNTQPQAPTILFRAVYNAPIPDAAWSGAIDGCNPGSTNPEYRAAILTRINFYRAMAGLPSIVSLNDTYSGNAQAAALMMSAARSLTHSPDPSWACYSEAGKTGAGNSNLALGRSGPAAIDAYIEDVGDFNGPVGHRRWVLYPYTQQMGTGDVVGNNAIPANALWVFDTQRLQDRPAVREPEGFVAWPPRNYVPYQVVYARWSFTLPKADFSAAQVTMQNANGADVPVTLETVVNGYGENTIVWRPNNMKDSDPWAKPSGGSEFYDVTVSNVMVSGQARSFSYRVIIFDPDTVAFNLNRKTYLPLVK